MINHLSTDLKIFKFSDGEEWWIAAKDLGSARKFFENESYEQENLWENAWNEYKSIQLSHGYDVVELTQDDDTEINIIEDDDLYTMVNRYRNVNDRAYSINIHDLLFYNLIEAKCRGKEIETPYLLASSVF